MTIEEIIIDYLTSKDINAFCEEQEEKYTEYVIMNKASDYESEHIGYATVSFDVYSDSLLNTSRLANRLKSLMLSIIELDSISNVSVESVRNNTDTISKRYRYYAEFDLVYYG